MHNTGLARFRDEEYNLKISHCYDFIIQLKFFGFFLNGRKVQRLTDEEMQAVQLTFELPYCLRLFDSYFDLRILKYIHLTKFILEQSLPKLQVWMVWK